MSGVPESADFTYRGGRLHAEGVDLQSIADQVGTPAYVYSGAGIDRAFQAIDSALTPHTHLVAYAVKANGNLSILRRLARAGAGADIVSGGELGRALKAGFAPERIVFSGVGKSADELRAALNANIRSIHVESAGELEVLAGVAEQMGKRAPVSLRVNPDVDAQTHPYISTGLHNTKFGVELDEARALLPDLVSHKWLELEGIACHIGSMVLSPEPMADAAAIVAAFAVECARAGAPIRSLDTGGGWPVLYGNEGEAAQPPTVFADAIRAGISRGGADGLELCHIVEPGRAVVGDAGVLLTRVAYVKQQPDKRFVVVDAAMTELIRPALYQAYHAVMPVQQPGADAPMRQADVVGPVCESADFLAKDRDLPELGRGDLLAIRGAGAYAAAMASQYNGRPRAAEVMVDADQFKLVRKRESVEDLWRDELDALD